MRRRNAFTLIELLVVVAILSLLVSLLLPSLRKAKALAKTTLCLSNQRQIGLMTQMYLYEWNGFLPATRQSSGRYWDKALVETARFPTGPSSARPSSMSGTRACRGNAPTPSTRP